MNVLYYTFGCKVNQYETENIREQFSKSGFNEVKEIPIANMCIINTCTVTAQSDTKCRQLVHKIRKENPACILVLAGCFPQAFPEQAQKMFECDIIVGSKNKTMIPNLVQNYLSSGMRIVEIPPHEREDKIEAMANNEVKDKTRAYIKIQDGCDMYCTYCIIPKARGHIRSKKLEDIKNETCTLINNGHKEIILTGINLCCYGRDFKDNTRLIDAIEAVCKTDGDFRVRISSIEPEMISNEDILRMTKLEKLCPQFHLSLQSGCDKTLMTMNRHYDCDEYALLCEKLRNNFDNCAITTDIMVGFPQETDEDFEDSLEFARKISFADSHIFPYSRRSGTVADKLNGQIEKKVKQFRASKMAEVCNQTKQDFLSAQVGTFQEVLFEKESSFEYHQGHTRNYVLVKVNRTNSERSLRRQFLNVKITSAENGFCMGELVSD